MRGPQCRAPIGLSFGARILYSLGIDVWQCTWSNVNQTSSFESPCVEIFKNSNFWKSFRCTMYWFKKYSGTCLAVQQLRLCTSTAGGMGLISDGGTKILHDAQCGQKKSIHSFLGNPLCRCDWLIDCPYGWTQSPGRLIPCDSKPQLSSFCETIGVKLKS